MQAAERIHGDDTTVPLWTYVRDDRPFGGPAPPAAMFRYSRDRTAAHPNQHLAGYAGILQADAYAGYNALYETDRKPGPIIEAACRVGGDVAIPAPHRPGRADFPHPVLHARASLRDSVSVDDPGWRQRVSREHFTEARSTGNLCVDLAATATSSMIRST